MRQCFPLPFIAFPPPFSAFHRGSTAAADTELVVGLILHIMYEVIYGFMLGTLTTIVMESRQSKKEFEDKLNSVSIQIREERHCFRTRKPAFPRGAAVVRGQ